MPKVKTLPAARAIFWDLARFPNFSVTGSIKGMKKLYYGKDALLIKCGSYIYNVSSQPHIYHSL